MSICKLASQWRTVHYLVRPHKFKMFKISTSDFGTLSMRRQLHTCTYEFLSRVTEDVVHSREGSVAYFLEENCVLVYPQLNRPTNQK